MAPPFFNIALKQTITYLCAHTRTFNIYSPMNPQLTTMNYKCLCLKKVDSHLSHLPHAPQTNQLNQLNQLNQPNQLIPLIPLIPPIPLIPVIPVIPPIPYSKNPASVQFLLKFLFNFKRSAPPLSRQSDSMRSDILARSAPKTIN